ncbi:hypothetical protein WMY93_010431 [Mugilogobius chulae]|uniref:Multidrug and toxin extrusion protein n=1 Tax=Mugilogobius chulae TaxID=88201 RepID=A0AAW0P755_9GOBI
MAITSASCLRRGIARRIPDHYKEEIREIFKVCLPMAVNMAGIAVGTGLALTYFGSGNLKRVGILVQRCAIFLGLAVFPCCAVLINTETLALLFKQSPEVACLAQSYVKFAMAALPNIVLPQVYCAIVANGINAVVNYILLYVLEEGVTGSAIANLIAQYVLAGLMFFYMYVKGLHKPTWPGCSWEALQEWWPFFKLAILSLVMTCLEFWVYEGTVFMASEISETELNAQSIVYQIVIMTYMIPLGLSIAASVRVGHALGAGNIDRAKLSSKVVIVVAGVLGVIFGVLIIALRRQAARLFTEEEETIERYAELALVYALLHAVDAVVCVCGGVLRGAGKLNVGTLCNLVGYYFIGLPVGYALQRTTNLGIKGVAISLTVAVVLMSGVFFYSIYKLDWELAAKETAGVETTDAIEIPDIINESNEIDPETIETTFAETSLCEAPAAQTSTSEATAVEKSASKTTAAEVTASKTTAFKATDLKATAFKASASEESVSKATAALKSVFKANAPKKSASEAVATKTSPSEATAAETSPSKVIATKTSPPKATTAETSPSEATTAKTSPSEATAAEASPSKATAAKTSPSKATAAKTSSSKATAAEISPFKTTAAEIFLFEATAAKTSPTEVTAAETSPSKATAAETSVSEATADDTPPALQGPAVSIVTVGQRLSFHQLLFWRGLILLLMMLILCAGIVTNKYAVEHLRSKLGIEIGLLHMFGKKIM